MGELRQEEVSIEVDKVVFRDDQSFLLIENIQNVTFSNRSLVGHVRLIFQRCLNVHFDAMAFEKATFAEIHLHESTLAKSAAFETFDKFILVRAIHFLTGNMIIIILLQVDHGTDSALSTRYDSIASKVIKTVIIAGNSTPTHSRVIRNLYSKQSQMMENKCVGIYMPIPVFGILVICLAIVGISLIWTKWILESERRLLRWYVNEAVGDAEEFIEEDVLLRNGNVVKSGVH